MLEDIKKSLKARILFYIYIYIYIYMYIYIYIYVYLFSIVINNYFFYKDLTNKILKLFVPK